VVAADVGGVKRTAYWADKLGVGMAIVHKERSFDSTRVKASHVIGDVVGKHCLIVDDMIDTGNTLIAATHALENHQASGATAFGTHPIFSGSAERYLQGAFDGIIVTDTVPLTQSQMRMKGLEVLTVTGIFAETIKRIHNEKSVSELFGGRQAVDIK
jgi:ribose-phosphate pyrophosphokinase